ncbi:MAG: hypothetical protein ABIY70_14110 [Capsulimonas sp.]|uniref:hypothetical protein n=1 Tax=Capsulimonas sp. TaxID=2494211 RepID=UPI003263C899
MSTPMQGLLPTIGLLGGLMLAGCSHNDQAAAPTGPPPPPPASVQKLPPGAQSAISSAVPPNDLNKAQPATR